MRSARPPSPALVHSSSHSRDLKRLFGHLLPVFAGSFPVANNLVSTFRNNKIILPLNSSRPGLKQWWALRIRHDVNHLDAEGRDDFETFRIFDQPIDLRMVKIPSLFNRDIISIRQHIYESYPSWPIHPNIQVKFFSLRIDKPIRPLACPYFDATIS